MAKKLQLLRNNSIYANHDAALNILSNASILTNRADGEVLIARYFDENGNIKSILGIVAISETSGSALTIVDMAKVEGELGTEIESAINGAGLGEGGVYTPNASANYISTATSLVDADNKLDAAIKKLQDAIGSGGSVDTQIGSQINLALSTLAYDTALNTQGGDYVAALKQENGKISATMGTLKVKDVNADDKFLATSAEGVLSSSISVNYDEANKKIQLLGKGNEVVSEIDAAAFIKDGMVSNVEYNTDSAQLTITFNTDSGKEAINIDLSTLINTYTAGNGLSLTGGEFAVKLAQSDMLSFNENGEIAMSDTWDCGSYD